MSAVTEIPAAYDPCYCKSGKKYKFCHYRLDKTAGMERLKLAHQMYLDRWKTNADQFRAQNCYAWMGTQLQPYQPKRILDIGCGDGSGITSLMSTCKPEMLISVEDNPDCLEASFSQCLNAGLDVEAIRRITASAELRNHKLSVLRGELHCSKQLTLIQGDLLWDSELLEFVYGLPQFDAITVWLLGTYDIKMECDNIRDLRAFNGIGVYRNTTHQHIYRLASKILRPGGVVHFVDRGFASDIERLKRMSLDEHAWLSEGTGIELKEFESLNYSEATSASRITMENRLSGEVVDGDQQLALASIIATKR